MGINKYKRNFLKHAGFFDILFNFPLRLAENFKQKNHQILTVNQQVSTSRQILQVETFLRHELVKQVSDAQNISYLQSRSTRRRKVLANARIFRDIISLIIAFEKLGRHCL